MRSQPCVSAAGKALPPSSKRFKGGNMGLVMMQALWICAAVIVFTATSVFASSMSQKQFHTRLTMTQITALSLDHLLQPAHANEACKALYGLNSSNTNRSDLESLLQKLNDNMETVTTAIINQYYMAYHDKQPNSQRFFDVNRAKAEAFETINREKLETQKQILYPYLKASKFFSKTACETGQPWPESLADIREEMDSLPALKPLGRSFQTTYRSLLQ